MSSASTPISKTYPFAIANSFTQDRFGGNPAAIVFLDPSNTLTREERQQFAKGFGQPIVVYLTPTPPPVERPWVVSFDIQHFVANYEVDLCGHGSIAASEVVFGSATNSPGFGQGSQFPAFCTSETHTLQFTTAEGVVITSRKVVMDDEDWFEIVLPAAKLKTLTDEEEGRVVEIFTQAMGKEPRVKYIGMGEPPFQQYLLIVLEESENLEKLKFVDIKTLVGKPQVQNSHSPRLKSVVTLCTESHRFPNPCRHHRFH